LREARLFLLRGTLHYFLFRQPSLLDRQALGPSQKCQWGFFAECRRYRHVQCRLYVISNNHHLK
jgi:hypothetical protein